MKKKAKKTNATKPTQVRLGADDLEKVDAIDARLRKDNGGKPNRSGAIRYCINRAFKFLFPE